MAAFNDTDISINVAGDIRWTGAATTPTHTVLEFIQWLMLKQDDGQAAGDDVLDITVDTPFDRSTDQIMSLNSPFNIDDAFATHLYDGSVAQGSTGNDTLYSGLEVIGPVETGTEYMILQDSRVLPGFWQTGINAPGGASLIFSRHLVKSRDRGADIDGKRITVLARELGDQYRRFPATLGTGNSVAAIGNGADIFNANTDTTIAGWTTVVNTEGFQELDIDGTGAAGQEFYSQWGIGAQSINDTYERTKWISQRSHTSDSNADVGSDFVVENATIIGQGQEFTGPTAGEIITMAEMQVKIAAGTPTGTVYCEIHESNDASPAIPTGGVLARSEDILATAITSSYETFKFVFNRLNPSSGADQRSGLTLATASDTSFLVIRHDAGDASNNFHVRGLATTGTHGGNRAEETGVWTGVALDDLNFTLQTSPEIHQIPGQQFEGINIEVGFTGEAGAGLLEDDIVIWGTDVTYQTLAGGTFQEGEYVTFKTGSTLKSGGKVLFDNGTVRMIVSLDTPGVSVLTDGDIIASLDGVVTAAINVTIVDDDLSGGEGLLLAKDDNGAAGEVSLQVISGSNPVNTNILRSASTTDPFTDFATADTTLNTRTLIPEFLGTSTGSNIIGAYGIGFVPGDVGANDLFISLDNASRQPPNNVIFTVSGLIAGEDRVLVGPRTATALERGQFLLSTALTTAAESAIVVKDGAETVTPVDGDIPDNGQTANTRLRVQLDTGVYRRVSYASTTKASDTFNISDLEITAVQTDGVAVVSTGLFSSAAANFLTTDPVDVGDILNITAGADVGAFEVIGVTDANNIVVKPDFSTGGAAQTFTVDRLAIDWSGGLSAAINNEVFVGFIDVLANGADETYTGQFSSPRNLFVRVRDGGGTPIKTFEAVTAQFLSTPQTSAAVRTSDA